MPQCKGPTGTFLSACAGNLGASVRWANTTGAINHLRLSTESHRGPLTPVQDAHVRNSTHSPMPRWITRRTMDGVQVKHPIPCYGRTSIAAVPGMRTLEECVR